MILDDIRHVLLNEWDPINVGGSPKLINEYDSYLPRVVELLRRSCSTSELADYREEVEKSLGLNCPLEPRLKAAERLVQLFQKKLFEGRELALLWLPRNLPVIVKS